MTELDKKIYEALEGSDALLGDSYVLEIKSLLKEVCEEVIGEDEDLGIRISDRVPAEISSPIIERNKFRAKIRIKLNEILGDVK